MKPNAPQWLPDHCQVTQFRFCLLPYDHSAASSLTIKVEWRNDGNGPDRRLNQWAIVHNGRTFGRQKKPTWTYEMQPSSRTASYLRYNRWPLDGALAMAETLLPGLSVMGKTAEEILAGGWV